MKNVNQSDYSQSNTLVSGDEAGGLIVLYPGQTMLI